MHTECWGVSMPVTMSDVADRAAVSIKTVSRVVNNRGGVSASTRQKVMAVIDEIGYQPNLLARTLANRRTHTVGLVIGDITNPYFAEVARGVQSVARSEGYQLFVANGDNDLEAEIQLRSLLDHGVAGVIIFPSAEMEPSIAQLASEHQPIVSVNRPMVHKHVGNVNTDMYKGMRSAVDHLVEKGHVHIGMLTGSNQTPTGNRGQRVEGYLDGLAAHNLPQNDSYVRTSILGTFEWGVTIALALLKKHPQITAIVCFNDLLAAGAVHACWRMGRRIPEDCAIIGFDDIEIASMIIPRLTTVGVDKRVLGHKAISQLLAMIKHPNEPVETIVMDATLIIRESA